MAYSRGYNSYRGRTPKWRIALMALLVVVILAAVAVMALSRFIVYDEEGTPQMELPWQEEPAVEPAEEISEPPLDLTIEEPVKPRVLRGFCTPVPLTRESWSDSNDRAKESFDCNAASVTLKDAAGNVYFNSTTALPGTVQLQEETDAALAEVVAYCQSTEGHSIARLSCFHDPKAANRDVENMGLKNTGGYIFYDGNNSQWLDPAKPAAREYLCGLAKEAAELGFDEILLTDVSYPTVGKLNKIDYGEGEKGGHLADFLEEMRAALAPYGVMLSIEVPKAVISQGADENAGLLLADIAPKVDRIYAPADAAEVPALAQAVSTASQFAEFVPELAEADPAVGNFLVS